MGWHDEFAPDETNSRLVGCEDCGHEGKIYHGQYEDERYIEDCGGCDGTGGAVIETRPIELEDLECCSPPVGEEPESKKPRPRPDGAGAGCS